MPTFVPGSVHQGVSIFQNPKSAAFDYRATLCMGATQTEIAVALFHLNAGQSISIVFPTTMPTTLGTYPVNLKITSGSMLASKSDENIIVEEDVSITWPQGKILISEWDADPKTFEAGEPYTITVVGQNSGVRAGYFRLAFLQNKKEIASSPIVQLAPGEQVSKEVTTQFVDGWQRFDVHFLVKSPVENMWGYKDSRYYSIRIAPPPTATVYGTVKDANTGMVIAGATVYRAPTGHPAEASVITDANGYYEMSFILTAAYYGVCAEAPGYNKSDWQMFPIPAAGAILAQNILLKG